MPPSDVGVRADEVAETPVPHERSDEQVAVAPPLVENIAAANRRQKCKFSSPQTLWCDLHSSTVSASRGMSDGWAEWEPPEWVAARGPYLTIASEHFAVRLEADGAERERILRAAPSLLAWLEAAYAVLCDPASAQFFVRPYATVGWSTLAPPRKLNVYCGTKAHPQTGWACQGTHVERVTHLRGAGGPEGKLHHSFLALSPGAAESQRTAVHEFAHCLQMHTGGHVDTDKVGYQWEAHAEYCTQLVNHAWAPHVRAYLETSYLPIDLTNYDRDGEGGGRQPSSHGRSTPSSTDASVRDSSTLCGVATGSSGGGRAGRRATC